MLSTLTQAPHPNTIKEWRFAPFLPPMFELAQKTGILTALSSGYTAPAQIAEHLGLSERGVRYILNCLTAAHVIAQNDNRYQQIAQDLPDIIKQSVAAFTEVSAAIEQGVLDHIAEDGTLPPETPQGFVTLGIAERRAGQLVLTEPGRHYFTPGQEDYSGGYLTFGRKTLSRQLPQLEEVIRTGRPMKPSNEPAHFNPMVQILFPVNNLTAHQLADQLIKRDGITKVLDLAAGSGVWSLALAKKDPRIQVTAFDLQGVLETTQSYVKTYGLESQYSYQPGDLRDFHLDGETLYDVIYLCYICCGNSAEENRNLIATCARNLRPGGSLVIADHFPKADWTGPLLDVAFSGQMLCFTTAGGPHPAEAYDVWFRSAGLVGIDHLLLPGAEAPVLVACKTEITAD